MGDSNQQETAELKKVRAKFATQGQTYVHSFDSCHSVIDDQYK